MKYDVVTIGDAVEDVFVFPEMDAKYDRKFASGKGICFEFGEKIPLNNVVYEIGGSACNVAVGLSRLGLKSVISTALGDDTPMEKIIDRLSEEDVDRSKIEIDAKIKTGFSVIFSIDGERTIFVYHGERRNDIVSKNKNINTRWLFLTSVGGNTSLLEKTIISQISEKNSLLAWNPGSSQIKEGASHFQHLLKCTSVLFLNREEVLKFTGTGLKPDVESAMKKLNLFGAKVVVVTNGREPAKAYNGEDFYEIIPRKNVERVDATGAGDAFATGFLARLAESDFRKKIEGKMIREALEWGMKNSESVIKYIGAQKGLLRKTEISI